MRLKKKLAWVAYAAAAGLMVVSFQNCDSSHMAGSENSSSGVDNAAFLVLQTEALAILQNRCGNCHDGTVSSNAPDVADIAGLRLSGYIRPGQPQNSSLYIVIIDGSMPEGFNMVSGAPLEVNKLRDWIQFMK